MYIKKVVQVTLLLLLVYSISKNCIILFLSRVNQVFSGCIQWSPQNIFLQFLSIDKAIHAYSEGWKYWPRQCRDRETQSVSFSTAAFRDGRDYGRITLHNMAAPNQIKAKTIKARVKATAVSSFKCLPPPPQPSKSVTLNSTVSILNLSTSGTRHKPLLHEYWTASQPVINPSKQSKQCSKWPTIILNLSSGTVKTCVMPELIRHDTGHNHLWRWAQAIEDHHDKRLVMTHVWFNMKGCNHRAQILHAHSSL